MEPKDQTVEGRLLALRQVLALVVAGKDRDDVLARLEDTGGDGQEDPGAVQGEGFAIDAALAEERRACLPAR